MYKMCVILQMCIAVEIANLGGILDIVDIAAMVDTATVSGWSKG